MEGGVIKKRTMSDKTGLIFPVPRIQRKMKAGNFAPRIRKEAAIYMASVIEYLTAEVLELAGNAAADYKRARIIPRHIFLAVHNDEELDVMFRNTVISEGGVIPNIHPNLMAKKTSIESKDINDLPKSKNNGAGDADQSK